MAPKHLNLVDYHPNLAIYLSTLHNSVQFNWDSSDIRAASVVCTLEPWCGCFWYCWGQSLLQHQVQLLNNLTIIMSSWIPHTLFQIVSRTRQPANWSWLSPQQRRCGSIVEKNATVMKSAATSISRFWKFHTVELDQLLSVISIMNNIISESHE